MRPPSTGPSWPSMPNGSRRPNNFYARRTRNVGKQQHIARLMLLLSNFRPSWAKKLVAGGQLTSTSASGGPERRGVVGTNDG